LAEGRGFINELHVVFRNPLPPDLLPIGFLEVPNCHLYGNGVSVFEINMRSKTRYNETQIGHITAKHHYGPHTIDIQQGDIILITIVAASICSHGCKDSETRLPNESEENQHCPAHQHTW
jgi:hypothetical protein